MNRIWRRGGLVMFAAVLLLGAAACFQVGHTTSVSVGAELPAPWGAVTIGQAVPMGFGW